MEDSLLWLIVFSLFTLKDFVSGWNMTKALHHTIGSIFQDFKSIINDRDDKDLKMTTILKPDYKGNEVDSKPPVADQHFKTILLTVNKLRDEFVTFREDMNNKLDQKLDKPQ